MAAAFVSVLASVADCEREDESEEKGINSSLPCTVHLRCPAPLCCLNHLVPECIWEDSEGAMKRKEIGIKRPFSVSLL